MSVFSKNFLCFLSVLFFVSCGSGSEEPNPCLIAEDFIKQDLINPSESDMSIFDCSKELKNDGSYTVLTKISAKNSFGVKKEFVYKLNLIYVGGGTLETKNWILNSIQSEEYRP